MDGAVNCDKDESCKLRERETKLVSPIVQTGRSFALLQAVKIIKAIKLMAHCFLVQEPRNAIYLPFTLAAVYNHWRGRERLKTLKT